MTVLLPRKRLLLLLLLLLLLFLPIATFLSYFFAHQWIVLQDHNKNGVYHSETETPKECSQQRVDFQHAIFQCLGKHKQNVTIHYPSDPYDHFLELQHALLPYSSKHVRPHKAPGYRGPWLENHWQQTMEQQTALKLNNHNFCSTFGPYIPLLTAWTDVWAAGLYTDELLEILQTTLRPDVLYITVVQNDDGFPGNHKMFEQLMRTHHILIVSSGGYGHVPVPLLKQNEPTAKKKIPVAQRHHLVSYTGSLGHAPQNLRQQMMELVGNEHYYYGKHWRKIMKDSKFQLCPRGFGRSSYHVMEALQMGLIPIQVYLNGDMPWMPYQSFMQSFSFTTELLGLPALLEHLQNNITDHQIETMESTITRLIPTHFTYKGVLEQIQQFMVHPQTAALECQPLPKHPGTKRSKYFA